MNAKNQFSGFKTLDQIKSKYKQSVEYWHPHGNGAGDLSHVEKIDREYMEVTTLPKFKEFDDEVKEDFINFPQLISELLYLDLTMEVCGSWLWVTGPTYKHTAKLKELGLKYSPNKRMWYHRPKWHRSRNSNPMSMDAIRQMHGSDTYEKKFVFDTKDPKVPKNPEGKGVLV